MSDEIKALTAFRDGLDHVGRLLDPGVREIVIGEEVRDLKSRFTVGGVEMLASDAEAKFRRSREQAMNAEASSFLEGVEQTVARTRKDWADTVTRAKRLPSYADTVSAGADVATKMQAALLDEMTDARAESWLERHSMQEAISRYQAAEEGGRDRGFVRLVEERHGAGQPIGSPPAAGSSAERAAQHAALTRQLNESVEQRQRARVPAGIVEALAQLPDLEAKAAALRARLAPTLAHVGRAMRLGAERAAARGGVAESATRS